MLFADTIGDHLINLLMVGCLLMFFVVKIVAAVDDDGEIKKTASEGLPRASSACSSNQVRGVPSPAPAFRESAPKQHEVAEQGASVNGVSRWFQRKGEVTSHEKGFLVFVC